jgi:hypothetical protein
MPLKGSQRPISAQPSPARTSPDQPGPARTSPARTSPDQPGPATARTSHGPATATATLARTRGHVSALAHARTRARAQARKWVTRQLFGSRGNFQFWSRGNFQLNQKNYCAFRYADIKPQPLARKRGNKNQKHENKSDTN